MIVTLRKKAMAGIIQYPICSYSGVVTDILEREFFSPASLPFPCPCEVPDGAEIMERMVYEVSVLVYVGRGRRKY